MSNILIIKHGSLGDIVQISGVLKDIREKYNNNEKIFLLTTIPYVELLSACPYVDAVLIDKRLPRWNLFYLYKLKKMIAKYNFSFVYDLQNSSRTLFYKNFLFNIKNWNSAKLIKKNDINNEESVLKRFKIQLEASNIDSKNSLRPNFSWACINVDQIVNKYFGKKFVLIFPFSSPKLSHKQWPYFNELIKIIKSNYREVEIAVAPDPKELDEAKKLEAVIITNNNKPLNIMELAGLIKKSDFVIANDTGPAHIAAHLGKKGLVLFGYHTTAKKVSIETEKFKAISVDELKNLSAIDVYNEFKKSYTN